jgi:magnesium-transporting ATPase (P-type)
MGQKDINKAMESHVSGQSNTPLSQPAHSLSATGVASELRVDILSGLSKDEAASRLSTHGPNELGDAEGVQPLKIILAQIANAMTLVSRPFSHSPPDYSSFNCRYSS